MAFTKDFLRYLISSKKIRNEKISKNFLEDTSFVIRSCNILFVVCSFIAIHRNFGNEKALQIVAKVKELNENCLEEVM